ncbi:MAG: Nudix family hydrolase [Gammaproteobacteria bacterium]|nr:Nudix family hydrolase [Gammaproteobacteria bacterium]
MDFLHVAAAVIVDDQGRVLIAQRPLDKHQGGLWEFPGGKVEPGEEVLAALDRELQEEVGINIEQARPLIRVQHRYPERAVLLDVWRVDRFRGRPEGREGQAIAWLTPEELPSRAFPAANVPIIAAARLPDRYLITPEPGDIPAFLDQLQQAIPRHSLRLVQLRAKSLAPAEYRNLASKVIELCHAQNVKLLLNAEPGWVEELGADGVHLTAERLRQWHQRPLPSNYWVAASCHNAQELLHAASIGVDFAVLGPVQTTASHPEITPLGWNQFRSLVDAVPMPVYALGGLHVEDLKTAFNYGAQGIAAIRGLWG